MGDNYKNDGLEDFFRKRLEGFEEAPKSNMWSKIAVEIPAKPPLVWWQKPIWWMGGLLVAVVVFSFLQYQRVSQFEDRVANQDMKIKALQAFKQKALKNQTTTVQPIAQSTVINSPSVSKTIEDNPNVITRKGDLLNKVISPSNTKKSRKKDYNENTNKELIATGFAKNTNSNQLMKMARNTPVTDTIIRRRPMPKVDFLHFLKPTFFNISTGVIYPRSKIQPVSRVKFYIAVETGVFNTSYKGFISKSLPVALESNISGYHLSNTFQKQLSLLGGIQFNKQWSIELGFGFRKNSLTLFDAKSFTYSATFFNDTNDEGFPIAVYATLFDSPPRISYELANQIKNDGEDIREGDAFALNTFFSYNTQYLNLPFWLKMRIGKRRFHGFAKVGASWNVLTNSRYGLDNANLTFDRIVLTKASITNDALSNSFFELGVGMGIEYDFTQNIALALQSTYYHSLSTVLSSKQNALGLGLSMKYQF